MLAVASQAHKDWAEANATLIVGIVGIFVSGIFGPSIAALWTARRERQKDARSQRAARRDDLRGVVDEAAAALGEAVGRLRPALEAQRAGEPLPKDARDFLPELFTLGQRLRLRVPPSDPVVSAYDQAREQLIVVAQSTESKEAFDTAASAFDHLRAAFLDRAREALEAPIFRQGA